MKIILCSNGFANNSETIGTPGLSKELEILKIKKILHIGWAAEGLHEDKKVQNQVAIDAMRLKGLTVHDLPTVNCQKDFTQEVHECDAFYLNGGNPIILRRLLRLSNLDRILSQTKKPIIAASAGAMALGKSLFLGNLAPNPIQKIVYHKRDLQGLALHSFTVVPHVGKRIMKFGNFLFLPDGAYYTLT